jgi:hypothetical protein
MRAKKVSGRMINAPPGSFENCAMTASISAELWTRASLVCKANFGAASCTALMFD